MKVGVKILILQVDVRSLDKSKNYYPDIEVNKLSITASGELSISFSRPFDTERKLRPERSGSEILFARIRQLDDEGLDTSISMVEILEISD